MRVKRWTKIVAQGPLNLPPVMTVLISYSNDDEKMKTDGWTEDGYWDSEGNRIVAPSEGDYTLIDNRTAPGT